MKQVSNTDWTQNTSENQQLLEKYLSVARKDISTSLTQNQLPGVSDQIETRSAKTLMVKLAMIYGKRYITTTLPKVLYSKIQGVVGKWISQKVFNKFYSALLYSPVDVVIAKISSFLKSHGVPAWLVNSVAWTIGVLLPL